MLAIRALSDVMGAEVLGVDLSLPMDNNHFERILEAFHRHLLLVFPGQRIDEAQQVVFSRRFGELQVHVLGRLMAHATQERFVFRHPLGTRDVVMWDNRCTMHCATRYDPGAERRVIYRTVVRGDVPV